MKKTFLAVIALACMASCDNQTIENPEAAKEYGYINLGISANTEMVVTRATTPSTEELNKYIIVVTKEGVTEPVYSGTYADFTGDNKKVEAGTYTIKATSKSETEAYPSSESKGFVRLSGSNTVPVTAGRTSDCPITCSPINSKVSFRYTDNFIKVFTGPNSVSVSQTDTERKVSLAMGAESVENAQLEAAYFEAQKTLKWELVATLGDNTTKNYSKEFTSEANKWTIITFNVDGTSGSLNVIITVNGEITDVVPVEELIDPFEGEKAAV